MKWAEAKEKVILDIFKNKTSGKYFIGLDDEDGETAFMITPLGAVKSLELHLFEHLETSDPESLLADELITEIQFEKYREYLATLLA
ncbi:MAG: hypothetical protein H8D61_02190 [Deltaproteobacteria bacterium]|nr:hypothetical protein [Deltaproteobacteria bacterium]